MHPQPRRDFPLIDLRDTAGGRIAYLKGTRLTVAWVIEMTHDGATAEQLLRDVESVSHVRAALAYAAAFPKEIDADLEHSAANRRWIERQEAVCQALPHRTGRGKSARGRKVSR
jgi:uncharacterized protein (DUF433 family)